MLSAAQSFSLVKNPRRKVSIRRDGADFVVAFQSNNVVVFRHHQAHPLRQLCGKLRWEVVADVLPDPRDPATW
jgi:hypothetical protein